MANIKFSQFTAEADINNFADIVGYGGGNNLRITPANLASSLEPLIGPYLPLTAGATVPLTGDLNLAATGAGPSVGSQAIVFNGVDDLGVAVVSGEIFTSDSAIAPSGQDLVFNNADDNGVLQTNLYIDAFGQIGVGTTTPNFNLDVAGDSNFGGASRFSSTVRFNNSIVDTNGITGNPGYILKSIPSGVAWKQEQPGCQIKIVGTSGLANTNNGADFLVPYNTVVVNDDPTIFNPVVTGGFGNQGAIQVLESGRYEFFARYSSFDLVQPGLPTVDGTKFFRITAATDVAAPGIGTKQCILQDLIVATSTNGEANVTGGGFMDLNAGDYFKIIGFHTGATGGSGTQGFPVSSNAFFNEPMLWLVKIQ